MFEAMRYMGRVISLIQPYWRRLAVGTAMGLFLGVFGMITPYLSKLYFDRVYPAHDLTLLEALVIGTFVISVTNALLGAFRSFYTATVTTQLSRSMSLMFFNHLQHLTVRFFDQHRVGEMASRFQDVRASVDTVTRVFDTLVLNGVFLLLVPPVLFYLNPTLALLSLVTVPLTATASTLSSRWVRRYSKQNFEAAAEFQAFQTETLTHIRTLKSMAAEHFVFRSAAEQLQRSLQFQLRVSALGGAVGAANTFVRSCGNAVFTYVAWTMILRQQMSLGDFVAFTAYIGYLSGPVGQFTSLFVSFQQSAVSFGRMFEYLDLPVEQDPSLAFEPPPPIVRCLAGDIRLTDVMFAYETGAKPVLNGVSLHFTPGSVTAVVGRSGAGKSSLLRLLTRMEVPTSGEILFDGSPAQGISLPDLRRQIAIVSQEPAIFRGTILENLTLGVENVADERVTTAARICRLTSLIAALPEGYHTIIAEGGTTLSGGERQRVAIARAVLRDTPIVLFDEATSNIDVQAENEILREVLARLSGKTIVFVTHRVGTAALADRIVVMVDGRIDGVGTHSQLVEQSDAYRNMYSAASWAGVGDDSRRLRMVNVDAPAHR